MPYWGICILSHNLIFTQYCITIRSPTSSNRLGNGVRDGQPQDPKIANPDWIFWAVTTFIVKESKIFNSFSIQLPRPFNRKYIYHAWYLFPFFSIVYGCDRLLQKSSKVAINNSGRFYEIRLDNMWNILDRHGNGALKENFIRVRY